MNKSNFKEKLYKVLKWIMPEAAIIVGGLLLDLISKLIVQKTMELGDTVTLIPKLLNISYTLNTRAAFGTDFGLGKWLGDGGVMAFFIVFTFVAVGVFGYLLFKAPKKGMLYRVSFAMIIAGALGNLYDRMFLGYVRDFIQFEYLGLEIGGNTTFAIFNIADSLVVVGAIMLIIFILFLDKTFADAPVKQAEGENAQSDEQLQIEQEQSQEQIIIEQQEQIDLPSQTNVEE